MGSLSSSSVLALRRGEGDWLMASLMPPEPAAPVSPTTTPRPGAPLRASDLLHEHHQELLDRMVRWSALDHDDAKHILLKLEDRAAALNLKLPRSREMEALLDVVAMATGLAVEFAYCGRLMG